METKLEAGATFNFLDREQLRDELKDALNDFNIRIGQGVKYRRIEASIPITGTGTNTVAQRVGIGPDPGFTWAVHSALAWWYEVGDLTKTRYSNHFINDINPARNAIDNEASNGLPTVTYIPNKLAIVLHAGDVLIPQLAALSIDPPITPSPFLQVVYTVTEVPVFSEGLLNL